MKSLYIETSIPSYLTGKPNRDVRVAAWQQITRQWWDQEKDKYELYISELVIREASSGNKDAAQRRLDSLRSITELVIDPESESLATKLIVDGGFPAVAEIDALHVAIAAVQGIDLFLTWNCRHINNADTKPIVRAICLQAGYTCPEICTPQELLREDTNDIP